MSTHIVPLTRVSDVSVHQNADRLEIAKCYDWTVVTGKGNVKKNDRVVYVPVDSILPQELEDKLFAPDSKIKLNKHRVRSIKIRGHISQGMIVPLYDLIDFIPAATMATMPDGTNLAEVLKITKYEPPEASVPGQMRAKKKKKGNSNFGKYTDIENFKWYDRVFQDGERVYISEKLHGTSFRAGWFKSEANTLWKKFKKLFGFLPEWEFCWGSRTVQIQCTLYHRGYYEEDVYTKTVLQYDLKNKIPKGYSIYGEIVGDGIQKGYTYGCSSGEHKLYVYDVKLLDQWLDYELKEELEDYPHPITFTEAVKAFELTPVPCLYVGPFKKEILEQHREGDSTIAGQKVREGVVLKPVHESTACCGRKVLKAISEAYYLEKDNSDFH